MTLKKSSIIFLLTLFIILVFILGVRHGQNVEKTNKIINYLISIPPSPTLQPTQTTLAFKTYKHEGCKIQFLYPSFLEKVKNSSESAKFAGDHQIVEFNCAKNSADKLLDEKKLATAEVKLKEAAPTLLFNITNPKNGKNIFVEISKSLFPLFEKSLEFLP